MDLKPAIFEPYVAGLHRFTKQIGKNHPALLSLCTLEQRLLENASWTRAYGDTETSKAERSAIIYALNALAIEALGTSFNELCSLYSFDEISVLPYSTGSGETPSDSPPVVLRRWDYISRIAPAYLDSIQQFLVHVGHNDYEQAKHLYWQLVYFLGTRELWNDCRLISNRLLKLSDKEGDSQTKGSILVTGKAWPLLCNRHFQQARGILSDALRCFPASNSNLAVFYEYMADVEKESRNVGQALAYYREAMTKSSGIDERRIHLKLLFTEAQLERDSSRSKLVALTLLRDAFRELKSYKEGMVLIEMAKTLYTLKSGEALETARLAYSLLNNTIMMPSNAQRARKVLNAIIDKRPCPV